MASYDPDELLKRIAYTPDIHDGKPIIRGRWPAVEHVLGRLAVGDTPEALLEGHPWLEHQDILSRLVYAYHAPRG